MQPVDGDLDVMGDVQGDTMRSLSVYVATFVKEIETEVLTRDTVLGIVG